MENNLISLVTAPWILHQLLLKKNNNLLPCWNQNEKAAVWFILSSVYSPQQLHTHRAIGKVSFRCCTVTFLQLLILWGGCCHHCGSAVLWQQGLPLYFQLAMIQQSWSVFCFWLVIMGLSYRLHFDLAVVKGHNFKSQRSSLELLSFSYPVKKPNWWQCWLYMECLWLWRNIILWWITTGPCICEY